MVGCHFWEKEGEGAGEQLYLLHNSYERPNVETQNTQYFSVEIESD